MNLALSDIMDHPTGYFATPPGREHIGARDSRWTVVACKRTETFSFDEAKRGSRRTGCKCLPLQPLSARDSTRASCVKERRPGIENPNWVGRPRKLISLPTLRRGQLQPVSGTAPLPPLSP